MGDISTLPGVLQQLAERKQVFLLYTAGEGLGGRMNHLHAGWTSEILDHNK